MDGSGKPFVVDRMQIVGVESTLTLARSVWAGPPFGLEYHPVLFFPSCAQARKRCATHCRVLRWYGRRAQQMCAPYAFLWGCPLVDGLWVRVREPT
jgi:hypothetical protein